MANLSHGETATDRPLARGRGMSAAVRNSLAEDASHSDGRRVGGNHGLRGEGGFRELFLAEHVQWPI
jgi:hypothetical protein